MSTIQPSVMKVGPLLQYWRKARGFSQLALALEADVSPRHLCFVETGRSNPSREMVMLLGAALDLPLRERNDLLLAAGFAPVYRESSLDAPELGMVHEAIDAILRQQEPYPSVVMNRRWDIVKTNDAAAEFFSFLLDRPPPSPANVLRLMFHPDWVRPHVANWEAVGESLIQRAHREAVGGLRDEATSALIEEILGYPGVPRRWKTPALAVPSPVVPVEFVKGKRTFRYFSAISTLGTAQDVTLQELRIESFFPLDAATQREARELRGESGN